MNVAIVNNMLSPYWIPVFNYVASDLESLTIVVGVDQEPNRQYQNENFKDRRFDVILSRAFLVDLSKLWKQRKFFHIPLRLFFDLVRLNPQVVISNELGLRTICSVVYAKLSNKPVIIWFCCSAHTERSTSRAVTLIRRVLLRLSDACITNMIEGKEYIRAVLHCPDEKIFMAPYAVDWKKEAVLKSDREKVKLLFVGQIVPRKGIKQLVQALAHLSNHDRSKISLTFVGGRLAEEDAVALQDLCVEFVDVGFIQPNEIGTFYADADIFVFPSLEDEWGIVNNEAVSYSLPCLSSIYAASTRELVCDGLNGYTIDPYETDDFATKLARLVNMSVQERFQLAGRSRGMSERVTPEKSASAILAAVHYAINARAATKCTRASGQPQSRE